MKEWIDEAADQRKGEEIDAEALKEFLYQHLEASGTDEINNIEVLQFPGGHSNLTYLVICDGLELVLRRPPVGNKVASAHDMGREYRVLSKLCEVYPPAPRPYLYCDDEEVLGVPFYLMERRQGIILRRELPAGLNLPPVLAGRLSEAFIDNLAALHTLDYEAAGLGKLGRPEGYVKRQVEGWVQRYQAAQTDEWPELDEVAAWLIGNMPEESRAALIHNDYKFDNLVLDPTNLTRIVGVLDWEMSTIGDPLMDLGSTLAYWVEAGDDKAWRANAFGPTFAPGSYSRSQLVERYGEVTGWEMSSMTFYFAFGLYKLAGIGQQIYARYAKGLTKDKRFAKMNQMVGLIGRVGVAALERDKV